LTAQARFYEEEEIRGSGPIIPSMKAMVGFSKR
jgi:hypothetical protein